MGTGRILIQQVGYGRATTRTLPALLTSLPPSDASKDGSIFGFSGFWAIFDRWKGWFNHKLIKRRGLIVKVQCGARELSEKGYV